MIVLIAMHRAVNLGKNSRIKMDALRAMYDTLDLRQPQTYVQSGNVVFGTQERDLPRLANRIEEAFATTFGFRSAVILRTAPEMADVVKRNPFGARTGIEPGKLGVTFLVSDPGSEARAVVRAIKVHPEELWIDGSELYIYFPNGLGRSKLPSAAIDRALRTPGTTRNWNSVTKLLEIAEKLQASLAG